MKLPRDLSGAELIKHLCKRHGYQQVNQEGNHVILKRMIPGTTASPYPITIPYASEP